MKRTLHQGGVALLVCAVGLVGCSTGPRIDAERRAENVASFDVVWKTVRDGHWDESKVGESWEAARDELRPKVEVASSDRKARGIMNEMLGRLEQSHFGVIPAAAYKDLSAEGGDGDMGMTVRLRDGRAMVMRVREGSPAEASGIKPGWILESVDDTRSKKIIKAAREASSHGPRRADTTVAMIFERVLSGDLGKEKKLRLIDGEDQKRVVSVTLAEAPGSVTKFGALPEFRIAIDSRTLDGGIGYFWFTAWFDPANVMPAFQESIVAHKDAPGYIIDLRGNTGGMLPMSSGMGGFFISEKGHELGTMMTRQNTMHVVMNPRRGAYEGPVAVLIDELSVSNSEIFAGGMKDMGRARVFGRTTAGLVLPASVKTLPNGDGFISAFADYESASGQRLEGVGVVPDVAVEEDRGDLLEGHDPVLEAAVAWILEGGE